MSLLKRLFGGSKRTNEEPGDRLNSVHALIASGADVNGKNNEGITVLMREAMKGNTDAVKALIAVGADVNAQDNEGLTPLLIASLKGQTDCVKALIAAGANVNAKSNDGKTVLMWTAVGGNADCVKALIAADADVNAKKEARGVYFTRDDRLAAGADGIEEGWTAADFADLARNAKVAAILRQAATKRT